jgi:TPR repeat protein
MCGQGDRLPKNHAESFRWTRLSAGQGNALAQLGVGHAYYNGEDVAQDTAEAVNNGCAWRQPRACQMPWSASARSSMGMGTRCRRASAWALALFRLAANAGKTVAQFKMAKRYETGDGVRQDPKKTLGYLRRPAGQNYRPAMYALGETHSSGILVARYQPEAQHSLGLMHEQGVRMPANLAEALRWFRRAAEQGSE